MTIAVIASPDDALSMFKHAKEEEIRVAYQGGKSIRETAIALGLGRGQVGDAVGRMGIARPALKTGFIDWDTATALYRAGHGTKAIAKRFACSHAPIRQGLIKRGVYQANRPTKKANGNSAWAGYVEAEICPQIKAERQHQAWWREAHPTLKKNGMERYYANHEQSKQYHARLARERYQLQRLTPQYKAKQFARAQLRRIKRQAMGYAKTCRTHEYLGCTYQQAADHITAQLPAHWTWQNYGVAWEIDHRIQLSDGMLTDPEHIKRVCHHTNLRPMSVRDNRTRAWGSYAGKQLISA